MMGVEKPAWLPSSLPFPRVGAIYQRFTSLDEGVVQNIIQGGDGLFVTPGDGLTFTVNAQYRPSGPRTIELVFKSAQVGNAKITDGLEALIAPSVLPRGTLQQRLLLAAREARPRGAGFVTHTCGGACMERPSCVAGVLSLYQLRIACSGTATCVCHRHNSPPQAAWCGAALCRC
jgi:hypothetical protein